jgi:hypothetical protein
VIHQGRLGVKQDGKVVDARRRIGVLGAEHFLTNRKGLLCELTCPLKVP